LLAKWAVVGVPAHVPGSIIAIIAVCWIKRPYEDEPARECLKFNVLKWIWRNKEHGGAPDKEMCDEVKAKIKQLHPDSIWAWIHYSDSRKELIEWGRRKLHYAYLAENWSIAIVLGGSLGSAIAIFIVYLRIMGDRKSVV
jgi:hypothetical protein